MDNVIRIENLDFSYGRQQVIKKLSLNIKRGKITTLIGANGCGKSTLFNLITKNLKADRGNIFFDEIDINKIKLKDFAKKVSIVHQNNTAPYDITVEKLVSYGRTPYQSFGISKDLKQDREKIERAMKITGITELKDKQLNKLSGGQIQRVWLAMALAQDTGVLFLDEPTTYLDISYQIQILKIIQKLQADLNLTVIMVLHDINQALYYSDELIAMQGGSVIANGRPQNIINKELIKKVYDMEPVIKNVDGKQFVLPI